MTKYNVLLSKTHSLAASLGAPPTRKGQTSFRQIVPHPFAVDGAPSGGAPAPGVPGAGQPVAAPSPAPNQPLAAAAGQPGAPVVPPTSTGLDPQLDAMLDALLDGRRAPTVLKNDITNVGRLRLPGGEAGVGINLEELRAMEARLEEVRRAHDARCARGVEAVRQLKDKVCFIPFVLVYLVLTEGSQYDWKSRLLFDDSDTSPSGTVAGSDAESTHADEEAAGQEDEDMVEVAPEHEQEEVPMDPGMDTEEGTPTHVFVPAVEDSDSSGDEAEEVQPLQNRGLTVDTGNMGLVNGELGDGDGSDSDGMEDVAVAPSFMPSMYQNVNGGAQAQQVQQPVAEQSPVSALENLFSIDP